MTSAQTQVFPFRGDGDERLRLTARDWQVLVARRARHLLATLAYVREVQGLQNSYADRTVALTVPLVASELRLAPRTAARHLRRLEALGFLQPMLWRDGRNWRRVVGGWRRPRPIEYPHW